MQRLLHIKSIRVICAGLAGCLSSPAASIFVQTNLASDVPGLAANTDSNLKNTWGSSFSATSPFWISDQGANVSTLYNVAGVPQALIVSTPPSPTGQVFDSSTGANSFLLNNNVKATFIFDTLSGQIAGWNTGQGTTAQSVFTAMNGAVFTGLAIGNNGSADLLYASDFANGKIDVFDAKFNPTTLSGSFTDSNLPAGYSPYNIQTIGSSLYVEYDMVVNGRPSMVPNTGIVDVYDLNGNFVRRFATNADLNSPLGHHAGAFYVR